MNWIYFAMAVVAFVSFSGAEKDHRATQLYVAAWASLILFVVTS